MGTDPWTRTDVDTRHTALSRGAYLVGILREIRLVPGEEIARAMTEILAQALSHSPDDLVSAVPSCRGSTGWAGHSRQIPADGPGRAGAGAPRVAVVAAGTPVQIAITVVLNYGDPTRSVVGSDLVPQYATADTMPKHSENYHTCEVVRALACRRLSRSIRAR